MAFEPRHARRHRVTLVRRRRIRRVLCAAAGVVVLGAATGSAAMSARPTPTHLRRPAVIRTEIASRPPAVAARAPAVRSTEPVLTARAATPPAPPAPHDPEPPLPTPSLLPDAGAQVRLVEIGRIRIPKIGLDQPVREGVEQTVIDAGPAHWPGTAAFGAWGNTVLAGHRSTHTEPFRRAAELVAGDAIVLTDLVGTFTYRVTGTEVVANTALWIVDQQAGRHLTIFTCHPIGSSAQRFVVRAELMSTPRPGQ
jgi:sortase A